MLGRHCLGRRIPDRATLAAEVATWERDRNDTGCGVDWRFTTAAQNKLKRLDPIPLLESRLVDHRHNTDLV